MQDFSTSTNPLRVVVQLSRDTVVAVHSGLPVEVLFASYEPDALHEHCDGFTDQYGKSVALWMDGSEGHPSEAPIVAHLFGQYCRTASLSELDRESTAVEPTGMTRPQLNQLSKTLRSKDPLPWDTRALAAKAVETLTLLHGMLSDDEWNADLYDRIGLVLRQRGLTLDPLDFELSPQGLEDKYSTPTSWGEHPRYSRADWQAEVANEDSQAGYWEWVYNRIQNGDDDES